MRNKARPFFDIMKMVQLSASHDREIAIAANRCWYTKSKIGDCHTMSKHILHGATVTDC